MAKDRGNSGVVADAERTARILIERHGAGAFDYAARQLALMNLADDKDSVETWRAIALAIEASARGRGH